MTERERPPERPKKTWDRIKERLRRWAEELEESLTPEPEPIPIPVRR